MLAGAVESAVAVPGGMSTSADTEDAVSRFSSDAVELVVAVPIVGTTDERSKTHERSLPVDG